MIFSHRWHGSVTSLVANIVHTVGSSASIPASSDKSDFRGDSAVPLRSFARRRRLISVSRSMGGSIFFAPESHLRTRAQVRHAGATSRCDQFAWSSGSVMSTESPAPVDLHRFTRLSRPVATGTPIHRTVRRRSAEILYATASHR